MSLSLLHSESGHLRTSHPISATLRLQQSSPIKTIELTPHQHRTL